MWKEFEIFFCAMIFLHEAHQKNLFRRIITSWNTCQRVHIKSVINLFVVTREVVSYICLSWSDRITWKTEEILTCKSFLKGEYRGEKPIELFFSWFLLKVSLEKRKYLHKFIKRKVFFVLNEWNVVNNCEVF